MDVELYNVKNKKARRLAKLPISINDETKEMALLWYFISWNQKIGFWPPNKRTRYAVELSKLSAAIPLHAMSYQRDREEIKSVITSLKLKRFGYDKGSFILKEEKTGESLSEMTPLKTYALFVYLVDSISKGLEEQTGFTWIIAAKNMIKEESKRNKQ